MKKNFSFLFVAVIFLAMGNIAFSQVVVTSIVPPSIDVYPTFADAFAAIQANDHGSAPTITVVGSFTETSVTGAILSNNSPAPITSIRIYTSGVFTVTGSVTVAAPFITFNNIDNSIIDGRIGQAGANRDLTFKIWLFQKKVVPLQCD